MQITETKIKVSELCSGYKDDGDGGVFGYDGKLTIRPAFQREFVYKDKQRDAVIETVRQNFPLNVMYWSKVSDSEFEVLDGQQHFGHTNLGWNDEEHFKRVKERDELKNEYCKSHGIPLIRIPYTQYEELSIEDLRLETTKFRVI